MDHGLQAIVAVLFLAVLVAVSYLAVDTTAAPPTKTVTLPDIAYEITYLPIPINRSAEVFDVNNSLQVVGQHYTLNDRDSVGFLYNHPSSTVLTLADLISPEDLDSLAAAGFTQSKFRGINDSGVIVGYVGNADFSVADGIIVDSVTGVFTRTSELFPSLNNSYLLHINNWGDLVGGYHVGADYAYTFVASYDSENASYEMRDFGRAFPNTEYRSEISDTGLVMLPSSSKVTWQYDLSSNALTIVSAEADQLVLWSLDQSGVYVGSWTTSSKRGSKVHPVAVDPTSGGIIWQSARQGRALAINDPSPDDPASVTVGDILFYETSAGRRDSAFLRNPVWGEISIDQLIKIDDPHRDEWLQLGSVGGHMTQKRPDTNFGAIAGYSSGRALLLVPKPFAR